MRDVVEIYRIASRKINRKFPGISVEQRIVICVRVKLNIVIAMGRREAVLG